MSSIFQYASRPKESASVEPPIPGQQSAEATPAPANTDKTPSIFQVSQSAIKPEDVSRKPHPLEEFVRSETRMTARAYEAVAGLPGDISNAALRAGKWFAGKLGFDMDSEGAKDIENIMSKLPTSQNIREFHERFSGDVLKPQSKEEEITDEVVQDLSTLLMPVRGRIPFARAIGTIAAGSAAQECAKLFGFGEEGQQNAKLGAMTIMSFAKPGTAKKYENMLYNEAKALQGNATVSARHVRKETQDLIKNLKKGGTAGSKTDTLIKAEEILKSIKNGRIEVSELTGFKNTINEARGKLYKDPLIDKIGRKAGLANLNKANAIVDNGLKEFGKANPKWEKLYRSANEVHGAIAQSKKASNTITRFAKKHPHVTGEAGLGLLAEAIFYPWKFAATVGVGGGVAGGIKAYELAHRVINSPTLRKYYMHVFKEGLKENSKGIAKNMQKLDSELKKEKETRDLLKELGLD